MQEEVRDGLLPRDGGLALQPGERRLAGGEEGHVAERRDPPGERGARAAGEVVHPLLFLRRASGRRREMDVRVDPAGQEQPARRVDLACGAHLAADLRDHAARDADIGRRHFTRIDDPPTADNQVQLRHRSLPDSPPASTSAVSIARPLRRRCPLPRPLPGAEEPNPLLLPRVPAGVGRAWARLTFPSPGA